MFAVSARRLEQFHAARHADGHGTGSASRHHPLRAALPVPAASTAGTTAASRIFVNLPVDSLPRAVAFFTALGFGVDPRWTNDVAACLVVSDAIHVMLLTRRFFAGFTPKPVIDAHAGSEVLVCLTRDSREQVDAMVARAVAAGGRTPQPPQDHGFMYQHGFEDPDGHLWELVHLEGAPA